MNLRTTAANIIYNIVIEGCSLSDELKKIVSLSPRDQAFVKALSFGVCRRYFYLDGMALQLLEKPLKVKDHDIYCLLLVGLFQLTDMRVPAHAAVAETVKAAEDFKKPWAKNLLNALLRNYLRRTEELKHQLSKQAYYEHPMWMIEKFKKDWPHDWKAILLANNQHPPFALRVNQQRISREKYLETLAEIPLQAHSILETETGVVLEKAIEVHELPGFTMGDVSVQDGAAQLAATLLKLEPGQRVLDACSAPGGKTTHILECQPEIELTAIDCDSERLELVKENLQRLHFTAKTICADVTDLKTWWDGLLYDRILLDAPCSASGIIRRHPDIKLLRREEDVKKLQEQQKKLIHILWQVLKPGGILVYATCSIFMDENTEVIKDFLLTNQDAVEDKIQAMFGKECALGRQILPGMLGMDGFYYERLRKI